MYCLFVFWGKRPLKGSKYGEPPKKKKKLNNLEPQQKFTKNKIKGQINSGKKQKDKETHPFFEKEIMKKNGNAQFKAPQAKKKTVTRLEIQM